MNETNIYYKGIEGKVNFLEDSNLFRCQALIPNITIQVESKSRDEIKELFSKEIELILFTKLNNDNFQLSTNATIKIFEEDHKCSELVKDYWAFSTINNKFSFLNKQLIKKHNVKTGEINKIIERHPFVIKDLECFNPLCKTLDNSIELKIPNKSSFKDFVYLYTTELIVIKPTRSYFSHPNYPYVSIVSSLLCDSCNNINSKIRETIEENREEENRKFWSDRDQAEKEELVRVELQTKLDNDILEIVKNANDSTLDLDNEILDCHNEIIAFKSKIQYLESQKLLKKSNYLIQEILPILSNELRNVINQIANSKNKQQVYKKVFNNDPYDSYGWHKIGLLEKMGFVEIVRVEDKSTVLTFEVPPLIKDVFILDKLEPSEISGLPNLDHNSSSLYHSNFNEETGTFIMSSGLDENDFKDFSNDESPF
jgi:hypothetical protein